MHKNFVSHMLLAVHRTFRKTGKNVNITKSKILFFSYSKFSNSFYFAVFFFLTQSFPTHFILQFFSSRILIG